MRNIQEIERIVQISAEIFCAKVAQGALEDDSAVDVIRDAIEIAECVIDELDRYRVGGGVLPKKGGSIDVRA